MQIAYASEIIHGFGGGGGGRGRYIVGGNNTVARVSPS